MHKYSVAAQSRYEIVLIRDITCAIIQLSQLVD